MGSISASAEQNRGRLMARPRKPSAELAAKGAFAKDPHRARVDPPTTGTLPENPPPDLVLDEYEVAAWRQLVANTPPPIRAGNDVVTLEIAARLLGELRRKRELNPAKLGRLVQLLHEFGQTNSGRAARATKGKPDEKNNPLAEFAVIPKADDAAGSRAN